MAHGEAFERQLVHEHERRIRPLDLGDGDGDGTIEGQVAAPSTTRSSSELPFSSAADSPASPLRSVESPRGGARPGPRGDVLPRSVQDVDAVERDVREGDDLAHGVLLGRAAHDPMQRAVLSGALTLYTNASHPNRRREARLRGLRTFRCATLREDDDGVGRHDDRRRDEPVDECRPHGAGPAPGSIQLTG
jgi:hypothetical protein